MSFSAACPVLTSSSSLLPDASVLSLSLPLHVGGLPPVLGCSPCSLLSPNWGDVFSVNSTHALHPCQSGFDLVGRSASGCQAETTSWSWARGALRAVEPFHYPHELTIHTTPDRPQRTCCTIVTPPAEVTLCSYSTCVSFPGVMTYYSWPVDASALVQTTCVLLPLFHGSNVTEKKTDDSRPM